MILAVLFMSPAVLPLPPPLLYSQVVAGIDIRFTLTTKSSGDGEDDMSELYTVRWSWLFLVPMTIMIVNSIAILAGTVQNSTVLHCTERNTVNVLCCTGGG